MCVWVAGGGVSAFERSKVCFLARLRVVEIEEFHSFTVLFPAREAGERTTGSNWSFKELVSLTSHKIECGYK